MTRYLIIALAIVAGGLIGWWLHRRDKAGETTLWTKKASPRYGPGLPD